MKILFFNQLYYPNHLGGAEVSTQLLAEELAASGHEVYVCCTSDKNTTEIVNNVHVHYSKTNNLYWYYKNTNESKWKKFLWHSIDICNVFNYSIISKIIGEIKPDVVHTNTISGFSVVIWRICNKKKIPVCHTLRDYYLLCLKCTMYNGKICIPRCKVCRAFSFLKCRESKYVNGVVGISKFVLEEHLKHGFFPNVKIKDVIYNSVESPETEDRKNKTYCIGYLGSIGINKGVKELLLAFSKCNNKGYKLLIAGSGKDDYVNSLKALVTKNTSVEFVGKVNPKDFFRKIDLLVIPSVWNEPFGRVVIESISNYVPVIASNKGGIPELLDGRTEGVVIDTSDQSVFTETLQSFFDGKLTFDFHETDRYLQSFSKENIAFRYLSLYQKIIDNYDGN